MVQGIKFFARGLRLVGSDIATSGRLVLFAATGVRPPKPLALEPGFAPAVGTWVPLLSPHNRLCVSPRNVSDARTHDV